MTVEYENDINPTDRGLRVLIVNPFSVGISGNDEVLSRVLEKMDRKRFRFTIAQPGPSPYAEKYAEMGHNVLFVKMSLIKRNLGARFLAGYIFQFVPTVYRLIKICREYDIDVVHTNTTQIFGGGAAAKFLGLPSVYHAHSVLTDPRWVIRIMSLWFRITGDAMLSNSMASAEPYVALGFPRERVSVVGNPIHSESLEADVDGGDFRKEMGVGPDEPLVGNVGRVTPTKMVHNFIRAASKIAAENRKARFVVVGAPQNEADEEYFARLHKLRSELGLEEKLTFAGRRTDVPNVMAALDILVHAHPREGFGLVVAEAMAAGKPVVAPAGGGVLELIEDGVSGFLVQPDSPDDTAHRTLELLADPDRAASMGRAGREIIEKRYRAGCVADSISEVYLKLARKRRVGGRSRTHKTG